MEEITAFIEKLREERNRLNSRLSFVHEHKFLKEASYLQDKIQTINTILYELESVSQGTTKGIDSRFTWL